MTHDVQPYEERLASLWQEGNRDIAISFLKRAITPSMTLAELAQALEFPQVREHLDDIGLTDIFVQKSVAQQPRQPARTSGETAPRKRRSAAEMQALRDAVMERLQVAVSPTTTQHLCDVLEKAGHDVDLLQINRLLNGLEADGYVLCTGGKPKGWRLKPQGRTAPDPLVIRKASASSPTPLSC